MDSKMVSVIKMMPWCFCVSLKEQPQIEIVFTVKPKSPGVRELIREGIKAIREEFFRL